MTVLDAVLWGAAILWCSAILVGTMRYLGLIPGTKPPKRQYLFEDETGDRLNPFSVPAREDAWSTDEPPDQEPDGPSTDSGRITSADDTHQFVQPDTVASVEPRICPECGRHNQSAYSFCAECTAKLTH